MQFSMQTQNFFSANTFFSVIFKCNNFQCDESFFSVIFSANLFLQLACQCKHYSLITNNAILTPTPPTFPLPPSPFRKQAIHISSVSVILPSRKDLRRCFYLRNFIETFRPYVSLDRLDLHILYYHQAFYL